MSNNEHLVSIGMPVYNSEQHIRQALDSVLAQDYEKFELIISDNASTDGTQKICLNYAARDERIRYYRNERNMGMKWNMNRLLELASGEYFKWAGSHDFIAPSFISRCKESLDTNPQVVLAYPIAQAIDEKGDAIKEIFAGDDRYARLTQFCQSLYCHCERAILCSHELWFVSRLGLTSLPATYDGHRQ